MSDADYHLRHVVIDTGFSQEDDQIHAQGLAHIRDQLKAGVAWSRIREELPVADPELKRIILDDFVKMEVAQRHFNGGESLKQIAKTLRLTLDEMIAIKKSMVEEVTQASVKAYHVTKQKSG